MSAPMTIAVVPLDDRPVNTRLLADLAAGLGIALVLPHEGLVRGREQDAVDPRLSDWLEETSGRVDAIIVNLNQLVFGGYVSSRRFTAELGEILPRLQSLRVIRQRHPDLPIHAFVTLMRTKDVNDGSAEPAYWAHHGADIARHSAATYDAEHGSDVVVESAVPRAYLEDFYLRRLRLHALQLAAIEAVVEGTLTQLIVGVEDSRVESVSTSEREWLQAWIHRLSIDDRVHIYPGADEIAATLMAGAVSAGRASAPRMRLITDDFAGLDRIAAFEDVPLRETLANQARTAGVGVVEHGEDFVLAVRAPSLQPWDWFRDAWRDEDLASADGAVAAFAAAIAREVEAGSRVVVADVAQSNGGSPALIRALSDLGILGRLSGYAGWNTAGNTLGTALATGVAATVDDEFRVEQDRLLAHRLIEDVGYQAIARRPRLASGARHDSAAHLSLGEELSDFARSLNGVGDRWRLVPGSTRLPWGRLFEIDFDLEPVTVEVSR